MRDQAASASADRAGSSDGEKSLLKTNLTATGTLLANGRTVPWFGAGSLAYGAVFHAANFNFALLAEDGFFKREGQLILQIATALGTRGATAAAHVEHLSEQIAEDVAQVGHAGESAGISHAIADSSVTEAVVGSTLIRIGKDLVGLACLFEFLFGSRVVRIAIRMVLHGEFAVGAFQLLVRGGALYIQNFVIIGFNHAGSWAHAVFCLGLVATRTKAGRSKRSRRV